MSSIEDITCEYEDEGQVLVKELDKVILSRGAWCTIMFRYQELISGTDEYGPEKYAIRRYKKVGNEYRQQSKFVISSSAQARIIIDTLSKWLPKEIPDNSKTANK